MGGGRHCDCRVDWICSRETLMAGFEPIAHSEADYCALQEAYQKLVLDRDHFMRQCEQLKKEKALVEAELLLTQVQLRREDRTREYL